MEAVDEDVPRTEPYPPYHASMGFIHVIRARKAAAAESPSLALTCARQVQPAHHRRAQLSCATLSDGPARHQPRGFYVPPCLVFRHKLVPTAPTKRM